MPLTTDCDEVLSAPCVIDKVLGLLPLGTHLAEEHTLERVIFLELPKSQVLVARNRDVRRVQGVDLNPAPRSLHCGACDELRSVPLPVSESSSLARAERSKGFAISTEAVRRVTQTTHRWTNECEEGTGRSTQIRIEESNG